ncbi:MAG TPA: ATP phosphoribosyltransferase regulatory subunit [Thermoanaerobaculia bacterium]|nr:ATP phosphoribosyltransferase regulatory subunit [Thermoanaerobaculia bacterium]
MATTFRYPTGARPLLIEETARRRRIETRVVSALEDAGFAEVVLPIIDFAEPYAGVNGDARQSYRFTDRDGELVAVRSDFTPMVARALAPSLDARTLPLRVFYRGDVIRCEASRLGSNRELFQIGAELIGDGSVEADVELLRIAASLVENALVVYSVLDAAERRDEELQRALATDARFVRHESDDADAGYYTGLRFWLYAADRRTLLAQGGRYDALYARFGYTAPAVGFTFTVDALED